MARPAAALLAILLFAAGCRNGAYRASALPVEILAPAQVRQELPNLVNLVGQTSSRDVIQSGDVVEVSMVTNFSTFTTSATPLRVAEDGSVMVPLVGRVLVAGMELQDAEREISAAAIARGIFRNPAVTVTMKQPRMIRVTVVGSVKTPSVYELPRGASSVLAAIVAAGGLADDAGPDVEVRHTQALAAEGPQPYTAGRPAADGQMVSYDQAVPVQTVKLSLSARRIDPRATQDLRDGDVVQVPRRVVKGVYVLGLVQRPGEFAYPANQEIRVLDAVALAGGCSNPMAEQVTVIRQVPGRTEPARIDVSLEAAKTGNENLQLAPGDTVVVEQTPSTFAMDLIKTFFRFGVNVPLF